MILRDIRSYGVRYRHVESKREVSVVNDRLLAKDGMHWRTYVVYEMKDTEGVWFAVDLDSFRVKFEQVPEENTQEEGA